MFAVYINILKIIIFTLKWNALKNFGVVTLRMVWNSPVFLGYKSDYWQISQKLANL